MIEYRSLRIDSGGEMTVVGYPVVFNAVTSKNISGLPFNEVIMPDALNGAKLDDVHFLYAHDDTSLPLASTNNKSLELCINEKGLQMKATLPNTTAAKDFYESVKAGLVTGCSFAFSVPKGGSAYDAKTNTRTIQKIDRVYEVSATPFPAYKDATIEARQKVTTDPKLAAAIIKCNQILLKGEI